jgi:hypothetical protein
MTKTNILTKDVISFLTLKKYKVWRNNNGAVYDVKAKCFRKNQTTLLGVPDIIGYNKLDGTFIGVEIKTGKDKLSPMQIDFQNECIKHDVLYIVVKEINDIINHKKINQ